MADAIWAKTLGGRANELQPLNPFTLGRMLSCHVLAERYDADQRDAQHDECFKLIPAIQGVGYVTSIHMRTHGVWQDPRVPFVQVAEMTKVTSTWTRAELVDALAERGEFILGLQGCSVNGAPIPGACRSRPRRFAAACSSACGTTSSSTMRLCRRRT